MKRLPSILILAAGLPAVAHGQASTWSTSGSLTDSLNGRSITITSDWDGDGLSDVLIGEPGDLGALGGSPTPDGGSAIVVSGLTGVPIAAFYGLQRQVRLGTSSCNVPDLGTDGLDEILIGAPGFLAQGPVSLQWKVNGSAYLYYGGTSGSTGGGTTPGMLFTAPAWNSAQLSGDEFGSAVAAIGDVNGDGISEVAVGAAGGHFDHTNPVTQFGYVTVFDVSSGAPVSLYTVYGTHHTSRFGESIVSVGDINNDGAADFAVGAPQEDIGNDPDTGRVRIYSGSGGALLHTFSGEPRGQFGAALCLIGDLDGDSLDELVIGAPNDRQPNASGPSGSVTVLSGASLSGAVSLPSMAQFWAQDTYSTPNALDPASDEFGTSVANAGDLDGDGYDDLVIGSPAAQGYHPDNWVGTPTNLWPNQFFSGGVGQVRLVSVKRQAIIKELYNPGGAVGDGFGYQVASGGDLDGDGINDYVVASVENVGPFTDPGVTRAFSGDVRFGGNYGQSNGASIAATGLMDLSANQVTFLIEGAAPLATGLVFFGPELLDPGVSLGLGLQYVGAGQLGIFRFQPIQTDANGNATFTPDLTLTGGVGNNLGSNERWNFQFWFRTSSTTSDLTDAISIGFY